MALGDGDTWDETAPTNATAAVQIDDYMRHIQKGVRSRMAFEHEWPASQSATSEAGKHKFITFQEQDNKPTLSGTQEAALYVKTDLNLYFENSAGTEVTLVAGTAVGDGKILANATDAVSNFIDSKIDTAYLAVSGTNLTIATAMIDLVRFTSLSATTKESARSLKICMGSASIGGNTSTNITNLPFADATSYVISVVYETGATDIDQNPVAERTDGGTCEITNAEGATNTVMWLAIGV